jgi:hypothetical protein
VLCIRLKRFLYFIQIILIFVGQTACRQFLSVKRLSVKQLVGKKAVGRMAVGEMAVGKKAVTGPHCFNKKGRPCFVGAFFSSHCILTNNQEYFFLIKMWNIFKKPECYTSGGLY